jgi:hypothetical protein
MFQLYGQQQTLGFDQINNMLGLPRPMDFDYVYKPTYHPGFTRQQFLKMIMDPNNDAHVTRHTSGFLHPATRYVQRVLSQTIFGRGESFSRTKK